MKIIYAVPGSRRALVTLPKFAGFADLPPELRQRIITLSLPYEVRVSAPQPIIIATLLSTSKLVNDDTKQCLRSWQPVLVVTNPAQLGSEATLVPNFIRSSLQIKHVHLALYHDVGPWHVSRQHWPAALYNRTPHHGASAWKKHIGKLAEVMSNLCTISLDITMVPAVFEDDTRHSRSTVKGTRWLFSNDRKHWLVQYLATSSPSSSLARFTTTEVDEIVHLAKTIRKGFAGHVQISLVGMIAEDQVDVFKPLPKLIGASESDGMYHVQVVSVQPSTHTPIRDVLDTLPRYLLGHVLRGEDYSVTDDDLAIACANVIESTQWSVDTVVVFLDQYIKNPDWVETQLAKLMILVANGADTLRFSYNKQSRRRLIHYLAKDLKLYSRSEGYGHQKRTIVSREESGLPGWQC